jgi:phage shock protein C
MYCNYCGKVIQEDANLCAYCGTRVGAVTARQRLVRPRQGRKIAGICLAFAEYFDLDVTLIRVVWAVATVLTLPFSLIAYVIAWIIIPDEPLALPAHNEGVPAQTSPSGSPS